VGDQTERERGSVQRDSRIKVETDVEHIPRVGEKEAWRGKKKARRSKWPFQKRKISGSRKGYGGEK